MEIASQGEAQIEFNQIGEPTITFAENQSDAEQQNLLAEGTGDELEQSAETVKTEAPVELSGPMVEREGYSLVVDGEIEYGSLAGMSVYGINDEDVGEVGDVVLTEDGNVKDLVLDVGGFLGLGEKNVALPFEEFSILRSNDGDTRVYIDTTQEALENMPDYEG